MTNQKFKVTMHCASCAGNIDTLMKKKGIDSKSNPALKITKVSYDETKVSEEEVLEVFKQLGYNATKA